MKRKYLPFFILPLPILILLIPGCQSGGKRAPAAIDEKEAQEIVDRIETIKQVYHLCPSPAEMLSVIDVADLNFDPDLLTPMENVDKYLDTKSRTVALGFYITDLAYAALFGRHEETLDYLETVRAVAEQVRVTGAINDELIQKARDNVAYLDSLFSISNQAFINMLFFCERNDRPNTIVMLSAGTFIESLFLAVNLVDKYDHAGHLLQHLADQKYALDNLMIFAGSLSASDENVASIAEDLAPIKAIYDGIEPGGGEVSIQTESEASEDEPKKLVIGGGQSTGPGLSEAEFTKLKEETIKLRNRLVGG
jgi:hypothetical protein